MIKKNAVPVKVLVMKTLFTLKSGRKQSRNREFPWRGIVKGGKGAKSLRGANLILFSLAFSLNLGVYKKVNYKFTCSSRQKFFCGKQNYIFPPKMIMSWETWEQTTFSCPQDAVGPWVFYEEHQNPYCVWERGGRGVTAGNIWRDYTCFKQRQATNESRWHLGAGKNRKHPLPPGTKKECNCGTLNSLPTLRALSTLHCMKSVGLESCSTSLT